MSIQHYPTCTADYPEKVAGESPRATTDIPFDANKVVRTCNDCGASEIVTMSDPTSELLATLQLLAAVLEAPQNRFGKLEFYTDAAREAVEQLRNMAVAMKLPGSETVCEQAAKVARAVVAKHR